MNETPRIMVLLLEDDTDDAEMLEEKLQAEAPGRYSICLISTVQQALDQIRKKDYDMLLVDYALGNENGGTFLYMAKTLRPQAACVLITGYAKESLSPETQGQIQRGDIRYLNKSDLTRINLHDFLRSIAS